MTWVTEPNSNTPVWIPPASHRIEIGTLKRNGKFRLREARGYWQQKDVEPTEDILKRIKCQARVLQVVTTTTPFIVRVQVPSKARIRYEQQTDTERRKQHVKR